VHVAGFVEIAGSGWRRQRADAPLANTYRLWCDARATCAIYVHKCASGDDAVVADLSPLRLDRAETAARADALLAAVPGASDGDYDAGVPRPLALNDAAPPPPAAEEGVGPDDEPGAAAEPEEEDLAALSKEPIWRLPSLVVTWERPRADAKRLAKDLANHLDVAPQGGGGAGSKGRDKSRGAPNAKAGKGRRHGGYGIG
jgi:hypothetical protein